MMTADRIDRWLCRFAAALVLFAVLYLVPAILRGLLSHQTP